MHERETTEIYDAYDKSLSLIGSIKLYVHFGGMTELVNFLVCKQLAVPALLGCEFCYQFVSYINLKTRLVKLVDASTLHVI